MIKQEDVDNLLKTKAGIRKLLNLMESPIKINIDFRTLKVFDWDFYD